MQRRIGPNAMWSLTDYLYPHEPLGLTVDEFAGLAECCKAPVVGVLTFRGHRIVIIPEDQRQWTI